MPCAHKKNNSKLPWLLLLLPLCTALYCGVQLVALSQQDQQSKAVYEQLRTELTQPPIPAEQTQNRQEQSPPVSFALLTKINSDTVAWLRCAGTPIDYPIVQGDDNAHYLKHNINNDRSQAGCIFLDYRNQPDFSQAQSIVYGHNFYRNDFMFTSLLRYQKQGYYDQFPEMTLETPAGTYTIQLFSGYLAAVEDCDLKTSYDTLQQQEQFLQRAQKASDFSSKVTPTTADKIFTMCTCSENNDNERYLLHGVLRLAAREE